MMNIYAMISCEHNILFNVRYVKYVFQNTEIIFEICISCKKMRRDLTYQQVNDAVRRSAAAFASLGIVKGDHVAIFGENSAHWLFADQGIQIAGAATVVRGTDAPVDELKFIYDNSDAREVVGEMPSISV